MLTCVRVCVRVSYDMVWMVWDVCEQTGDHSVGSLPLAGDIRCPTPYARFGWTLLLQDLNADGLDELVVGAPFVTTNILEFDERELGSVSDTRIRMQFRVPGARTCIVYWSPCFSSTYAHALVVVAFCHASGVCVGG